MTTLFTARHYRWLAKLFRELRPTADFAGNARDTALVLEAEELQWLRTIRRFDELMLADNPAFDVKKFHEALGYAVEHDHAWTHPCPVPGCRQGWTT